MYKHTENGLEVTGIAHRTTIKSKLIDGKVTPNSIIFGEEKWIVNENDEYISEAGYNTLTGSIEHALEKLGAEKVGLVDSILKEYFEILQAEYYDK